MSDVHRPEAWVGEPRWGDLGGYYPYLAPDGSPLTMDFAAAVRARPGPPTLDETAVVTYLAFRFLCGDRTLVRGLRRAPWLSAPTPGGGWRFTPPACEPAGAVEPAAVAAELYRRLLQECREAVRGNKTVGFLLSGGLDSRIAAGILQRVRQEAGGTFAVLALTWGTAGCRDVAYGRRVAAALGWPWRHLEITSETLLRNLDLAGRQGCEVSALHLHALPEVGRLADLDGVIAATYGDSVGRGEYSGRAVADLPSLTAVPLDPFGILRGSLLREVGPRIAEDADTLGGRRMGPDQARRAEWQQVGHYLRRKLQGVMTASLPGTPLIQLFTSPAVSGLMWGLPPAARDGRYYRDLLGMLPSGLGEIPWARTGRPFGDGGKPLDDLEPRHHRYGQWLRQDLGAEITARVLSERVLGTGLFLEGGLRRLLWSWRRGRGRGVGQIEEIVAWLASLDVFLETYAPAPAASYPGEPGDRVRSGAGFLRSAATTFARNLVRP